MTICIFNFVDKSCKSKKHECSSIKMNLGINMLFSSASVMSDKDYSAELA